MWYKGTLQECTDYNNIVKQGEGYSGITTAWANVIQINTDYYIIEHPKYNSQMQLVPKLPELPNVI